MNWLALMVVLARAPEELEAQLTQSQLNAEERFIRDRSAKDAVFSAVAAADVAVVWALAAGTFGQDTEERTREIERIVGLFEEAFRRVQATSRQKQSATGQLASLERFLEKLAGDAPREENELTRKALKAIRERL